MSFYLSIGDIISEIQHYNKQNKIKPEFTEILRSLHKKRLQKNALPNQPSLIELLYMDDSSFCEAIKDLYYRFPDYILYDSKQFDVVPPTARLTTLNIFGGLRPFIHLHDSFEINYVYKGKAKLTFLDETRFLTDGDLCILSPFTNHDVELSATDHVVFTILVKEKTFKETFFHLLTQNDIISLFFKQIFSRPDQPNYLLFKTDFSPETKDCAKRLFLENFKYDRYTSHNNISLLELLFSSIMRDNSAYSQFSSYGSGPDYAPILRYIQSHYQSINLPELASIFNYTVPHLSKIIKISTGKNFTQLVKELRMRKALTYLTETSYPIEKIALLVGYSSADHFTRVFHKFYNIAPQKYRIIFRKNGEIPLELLP